VKIVLVETLLMVLSFHFQIPPKFPKTKVANLTIMKAG
jgi:hypothetical protein